MKTEEINKKSVKTVLTIATVFKTLGTIGAKNRDDLATGIIKHLASKGITVNVRGFTIKKERVLQQISAMVRDIKMERGKAQNSRWSKYKVAETEKEIKLVPN